MEMAASISGKSSDFAYLKKENVSSPLRNVCSYSVLKIPANITMWGPRGAYKGNPHGFHVILSLGK